MTSSWSYSQTTYPKTQIIDGDTVVVLSRQQAVKVNLLYSKLDQYKELQGNLLSTIDSCRTLFPLHAAIVQGYTKEIALYKAAVTDRDSVISIQRVLIDKQKKDIKKLKNTNKALTMGCIVLGIITATVLVL